MNTPGKRDIFEKIEGGEKNIEIWKQVVFNQVSISCNLGNSKQLVFPKRKDNFDIYCLTENFEKIQNLSDQNVVGQFKLSDTQYFFYSTFHIENNYIVINSDITLFKLQRRQVYRLKVPRTYQASVLITKIDQDETHIKAILTDLGLGGCCIALVQDLKLRENSEIHIELKFENRIPQAAEGIVRFNRKEMMQNKKFYFIGIQFKNSSTAWDSTLFSVMMELSRKYLKN